MAKFRYYITELFNGVVRGTNDSSVAESYAESDDCFVVDTFTNELITSDGRRLPVEEAKYDD